MLRPLFVRVVRALLLLEALSGALWIARLLPGLPARAGVTSMLVLLRAAISVAQVASFILLVRQNSAGLRWGRVSLLASALVIVPELGWRLAPTNTDPTYRWHYVAAYWMYAAVGWMVLRDRHSPSGAS
jgi:hypothetical protein